MTVVCRLLEEGDCYERVVTGWVDARRDGALQLSARLTDPRVDVEVSLAAKPSPSFEIVDADARARSTRTEAELGPLLERLSGLRGMRIVSGLRRAVAGLLGPDRLAPYVADAAIEAARLSRQVTRIEGGVPSNPTPGDFHTLDLAGWPEFADMCFTYSTESRALFDRPAVSTPAIPDMYAPRPGTKLVFHRYKRSEVTRAGGGLLSLYQSMFDQVHGFELWYEVDVATHRIVRARSLTPRLPYMGICEHPQARVQRLIGVRLDDSWRAVIRELVGGREGCFQLMDLTSDIFRLLSFE